MKKRWTRLNYYQQMLLTYVLSAILFSSACYALLAGYFCYHAVQENQKASALAVQQMQKDLDNQFSAMENIFLRTRSDSDLVQAVMCKSPYEQYRVTNTLSSYCSIYPVLLDVAVFDYQQDVVQSAFGSSTPEEYFTRVLRTSDAQTCQEAIRTAEKHTLSGFYPMNLYNRNISYSAALYVIPISNTRKLVFALDQRKLLTPVEGLVGSTGTTFLIAGSERDFFISFDINGGSKNKIEDMQKLKFHLSGGLYSAESGGEVVVATHSLESGFYYCVISSIRALGNLRFLYLPLIVCILTMALSGIFIGILLAQKAYRPIQQLQDYVTGKVQGNGQSKREEFLQIRTAFDQLRNHAAVSEKDRELLRTSMLSTLTFSPFFYEHYPDFYQDANITFPYDVIQVAAIRLAPDISREVKREIEEQSSDADILLYPLEAEGNLTLILNAQTDEKADAFWNSYAQILQGKQPDVKMGISGTHKLPAEIWISAMQAVTALDWCGTDEQICFYRRQQNRMSLTLSRFYSLQPAFFQAVRDEDMAQAEKYLREILSVTSGRELRMFIYTSLLSQLSLFFKTDLPQSEVFLTAIQQVRGTTEQLLQSLLHVVEKLCAAAKTETSDAMMRAIETYIAENYTDSNLCTQSVAEKFEVSSSYISKYVKKFTEKTIFTLIDEQRMRCAQHLLESTELPIKEVVAHAGYVDVNNFIKKFKLATGYTPSLYRQIHASNGGEQLPPK